MYLCTEDSERRQVFFFSFCFIVIPDLTLKWRFQRIMTCHYLTEMGIDIFKRQYSYWNSKMAPDTCNATGLWLNWSQSPKLCRSFTVMVITQIQKELPKNMLTLHKSCVKQNGTERTANVIAKYFAFLQELQNSHF